jgi:phage terminase large subunit-like protein
LSKGKFEGMPWKLHTSQEFIVGSLFGWKRTNEDGELVRRFRRAYIEMGKANGKSPLAAGIGLYGMCDDNEPGAEIYSAGSSRDQANILFQDAVAMVRQSPSLSKRIQPAGAEHNVWKLTLKSDVGTLFKPLSREVRTRGAGTKPHMALCDEIHEHPDSKTIDTLERGLTKGRRQPLLAMFTNSGTDRNSICYAEHQHAVRVAHGDIEDDYAFSYVCALDETDDPLKDPSCWQKVNPLLGIIQKREDLAIAVKQAKDIPGKLNGILRLHFCVWTDAETAWISRQAWEACIDRTLRIEDFAGRPCYGGLDLGATKDFTAKALVFKDGHTEHGDPKFVAFAHAYTPADTLHARAEADNVPEYHDWVRDGHVTATPGKVCRYDFVATDLVDDSQTFDLVEVAYDRHLIKHFDDALTEIGGELPLRNHGQGFGQYQGCKPDCSIRHKHVLPDLWMPESVKQLEKLILERRIRVHFNPALNSAVASAQFRTSPLGLRVFEKQKANRRIDLAVALAMATGSAVQAVGTDTSTGYVNPDDMVVV